METQKICHSARISTSMCSYQIQGKVEKFDQHGTVRNWHKDTCGPQRRARDRANIAAIRRTLKQNPDSFCCGDAVPNT